MRWPTSTATPDRGADAETALRQVLVLEPDQSQRAELSRLPAGDRGDKLDEAMQLVRKALEAEPDNGAYLDSLGWAHFKRGDLAEAEKYLGAAAERMPRNSEVQDHLGDVSRVAAAWTTRSPPGQGAERRRRGRRSRGRAPQDRRRARQRAPLTGADAALSSWRCTSHVAGLGFRFWDLPRPVRDAPNALPRTPGTPMADVAAVHAAASAACRGIKTLTGELALSGRAGEQQLRGRVIAGFERAGSMRLEAWRLSVLRRSSSRRAGGGGAAAAARRPGAAHPEARDVLGAFSGVPWRRSICWPS